MAKPSEGPAGPPLHSWGGQPPQNKSDPPRPPYYRKPTLTTWRNSKAPDTQAKRGCCIWPLAVWATRTTAIEKLSLHDFEQTINVTELWGEFVVQQNET